MCCIAPLHVCGCTVDLILPYVLPPHSVQQIVCVCSYHGNETFTICYGSFTNLNHHCVLHTAISLVIAVLGNADCHGISDGAGNVRVECAICNLD